MYNFISDPGHGWLEVTRQELERLGILNQITGCSFQKGGLVYLEEDCDAPRFLDAKENAGEKVDSKLIREIIGNGESIIRTYDHFRS